VGGKRVDDGSSEGAQPAGDAGSEGNLAGSLYGKLSDLILNGEIAPGQLVTIQALSDAFGVSTMPVREALQRLTAPRR